MLNGIFIVIVLASILCGAYTGQMQAVTDAILQDSRKAVSLSIGLVGVMAFFLGLMKVAEDAGLLRLIARAVSPVMRRLFPSIPPEHPAMSAMIMNIASNMLGLGNAATPFGIKAMQEMDKLNANKGTATNAMVLFLAINTAGLAILPSGVVGLRAAAGSANAMGIWIPTWLASGCATLTGIVAALVLSRLPRYRSTEPAANAGSELPSSHEESLDSVPAEELPVTPAPEPIPWRRAVMWGFWAAYLGLLVRQIGFGAEPLNARRIIGEATFWMLPAVAAGMLLFGWSRGTRVYDSLVEGAKQGFQVALRIIPFLVAILVAVGMFRASGGMGVLVSFLDPLTSRIGMPAEVLPMAIIRPLSGSGALGVMAEAMDAHGPDSLIGYMVSTVSGSTETTFYVLAVYFGAVGIRHTRHALPACLLADAAGILTAVLVVNVLFG